MSRRASFRRALLAGAAFLPFLTASALSQEASEPEKPESATIVLDRITVVPTKTAEPLATSLAAVTQVDSAELTMIQPTQANEIFFGMPGVTSQSDSRRAQTSINIRGLQDFGRVAIIVDGARNNFQRSDHGTQSVVYVEPEMLKQVTVVRGPVSNIYGSGAIGGVVAFETLDAFDFLRGDETMAGQLTARVDSNGPGFTTSGIVAARASDVFGVIGNVTFKDLDDYENGNGDVEPGTGAEVLGGMLKASLRPTENQELEFGWIGLHDEWTEPAGSTAAARDTEVDQSTLTAKYEYRSVDHELIDLHISGYRNQTDQSQVQLDDEYQFNSTGGAPILIPAGSERNIDLETLGFDAWNTSRFRTGPFDHALTYGGDWFRDIVDSVDDSGGNDVYTPSGERQAYGAFLQDQLHYSDWLEVIGGLRFDGYSLDGEVGGVSASTDGAHLSPRLTIGVSPFERTALNGIQVYGTYAQGYRSPAVTETLMNGIHPYGFAFPFLPNPDLKPEIATTYELGMNFNRHDLFREGDSFRVKTAIFRNDVEDFIAQAFPGPGEGDGGQSCPYFMCLQYQNIAEARIDGFEFESVYDAGRVFTALNVTLLDGTDQTTGDDLGSVPPAQIMGRLGLRLFDRRLILGGEVQHVFDNDDVDAPDAEDYTLVNLFASYEASENFRVDARINNLFDESYANYMNSLSLTSPLLEPSFNAKLGVTIRFGTS